MDMTVVCEPKKRVKAKDRRKAQRTESLYKGSEKQLQRFLEYVPRILDSMGYKNIVTSFVTELETSRRNPEKYCAQVSFSGDNLRFRMYSQGRVELGSKSEEKTVYFKRPKQDSMNMRNLEFMLNSMFSSMNSIEPTHSLVNYDGKSYEGILEGSGEVLRRLGYQIYPLNK